MITAKLICPWTEVGGEAFPRRHPKLIDDYTVTKCTPGDTQESVVVTCDYPVWEAIVHDPEYGPILWYQEEGRPKRILASVH